MIKFRFHRSSLADSLKTTKTFNTIDDMFDYIENEYKDVINSLEKDGISTIRLKVCDNLVYDDRCKWNTKYVLAYGCCIGMCEID